MMHTGSKRCERNGESGIWKEKQWFFVDNTAVTLEYCRAKLCTLDQPFCIFISFHSILPICLYSFSLPSPSSHAFPYPSKVSLHFVTVDSSCFLVIYTLRPLCSLCLPLLYTEPDTPCNVLCNQFSLHFLTALKLLPKFEAPLSASC
jgi:hypothetical protein